MKNRSVLYFLAVAVLGAAPALADKMPDAFLQQRSNSDSLRELPNGNSLRDARGRRNFGVSAFHKGILKLRDLNEDGRFSSMDSLPRLSSDEENREGKFLALGSIRGDRFERIDDESFGRHHAADIEHDASSSSAVVAPEPESFTLVLLGVSVLGLLLYRRNSI